MSDNASATGAGRPKPGAVEQEIFSPERDIPPPTNQYLTELTEDDGDYFMMLCNLPPGAIVPMHTHSDRETFHIVSGNPELFKGDRWETLSPGDTVDVKNGIRHAWRNSSQHAVSMLCVTTMRMGRFLRDISVGQTSADPAATAQRFQKLVQEHGYWLASPEENAAIGLQTNWGAVSK